LHFLEDAAIRIVIIQFGVVDETEHRGEAVLPIEKHVLFFPRRALELGQ
jgi:hypothetical protein